MTTYPIKRTPEQGHTKACLAKAIIAAVENLRDAAGGDVDFRLMMQDNMHLEEADTYLKEGATECLCEPIAPLCDWCADGTNAVKEIKFVYVDDSGSYIEKFCITHFQHGVSHGLDMKQRGEIKYYVTFDI